MHDNFYSILGVARTASLAEIKKAYLRMARENHPDRFTDPGERVEADRRFQQITEAFNQLRDEKSRQEYDKRLAKETRPPEEEARLYYKNAELKERSWDFESALKFYYEAMRLQPENMDYMLAAGRVLAKDKSKLRQAAELFTKTIQKHPDAPEPHLELGDVYLRSGMNVRAKRVLEAALARFPGDPEIKRKLAQIK